ncbi:MAG: hypothetical protein R6U61_08840 [Thermoplasmata archaeon]
MNIGKYDLGRQERVKFLFPISAVLIILLFSLVPFIGYGGLIDSISGALSISIAIIFFVLNAKFYGAHSDEGRVWTIISIGLITVLAANIFASLQYPSIYFILRFASIPIIIYGIWVKLSFAGIDLNTSEKTVTSIGILSFVLLVLVSAVMPAVESGFTLDDNASAVFAITEILFLLLGLLIIQTVESRGWYVISVGLVLISMGDIFNPLARQYEMIYDGTPLRLFWYIGLIAVAYGAYYQKKNHLKLLASI